MSLLLTHGAAILLATMVQGGAWMEMPSLPLADRDAVLAPIGDLDGDGRGDLAIGLRAFGRVDLVSTATGATLGTIPQFAFGSEFGAALACAGDLDGDGMEDLAVAAPYEGHGGLHATGAIHFLSLPSGRLLAVARGVSSQERLGREVQAAGDLDGDGLPDFLTSSDLPRESVVAVSGATGTRLYQVAPVPSMSTLFTSFSPLGDLDGDRAAEFAIGIGALSNAQYQNCGWIGVYSGRSGQRIREIWGWENNLILGYLVSPAGDVDRDGVPDLLAALGRTFPADPYAVVLSGRTGAVVRELSPGAQMSGVNFTAAGMRSAPDLNGDGWHDLLLWNPNTWLPPEINNGLILVFDSGTGRLSGRLDGRQAEALGQYLAVADDLGLGPEPDLLALRAEGSQMLIGRYGFADLLAASVDSLSASAGGTIRLQMTFPLGEAGHNYFVLASTSGNGPTNFGGLDVPLTRDAIYDRMILGPPPGFVGARGNLDAAASSQAQLRLAPGAAAALVGRDLRFAAVSYEGVLGRLSSRAATIRIEP